MPEPQPERPRSALEELLDRLDGRTVTVGVHASPSAAPATTDDELLERLLAKLNRPGGPKISSRAIV